MYLAEDVYSQAEIDEAMEETDVKKAELELARQIVEGLAAEFDPEELTSAYRRDLRTLLEAKMRGEELTAPQPAAEPAPAVDLIEALKASVAAAKTSAARPKKAAAKPAAEKQRPARKAARK
jgi:DNA end-binding protein Ku